MITSVQNYSSYNRTLRTGRDFEPDQTLVDRFHETNQGGRSVPTLDLSAWARREDAPLPALQSSRYDSNVENAVLAGGVQRPSQEGIASRPTATPERSFPPLERPHLRGLP